jgi:hypothetical protein
VELFVEPVVDNKPEELAFAQEQDNNPHTEELEVCSYPDNEASVS